MDTNEHEYRHQFQGNRAYTDEVGHPVEAVNPAGLGLFCSVFHYVLPENSIPSSPNATIGDLVTYGFPIKTSGMTCFLILRNKLFMRLLALRSPLKFVFIRAIRE